MFDSMSVDKKRESKVQIGPLSIKNRSHQYKLGTDLVKLQTTSGILYNEKKPDFHTWKAERNNVSHFEVSHGHHKYDNSLSEIKRNYQNNMNLNILNQTKSEYNKNKQKTISRLDLGGQHQVSYVSTFDQMHDNKYNYPKINIKQNEKEPKYHVITSQLRKDDQITKYEYYHDKFDYKRQSQNQNDPIRFTQQKVCIITGRNLLY